MFLMAVSLVLQYCLPRRGLGQHGNDQLLYRGFLHALGLPIQYASGMFKAGIWYNTAFETKEFEIAAHLMRAFWLVPFATWAICDQWVSCGVGKRTDDIRTAGIGSAHPNQVNNLMHKISPHKGHRNLLIRGVCTCGQASVTVWLIIFDVSRARNVPHLLGQIVSASSLFYQWRTGNPKMFVVRGASNWYMCMLAVYAAACGSKTWMGQDPCNQKAWGDERLPLKIIACLASLRMLCNGLSLFCQFRFPHRMFRGHGNEQLFYRGTIQLTGIPLHVAAFCFKAFAFDNSSFPAYETVEIVAHLLRGLMFIPISGCSLYHQWYNTRAGHTGHPVSDMYEREMDPSIDNHEEQLKVTIFSARGLRRGDILSSDPYCTCSVMGRPESSVSTKWINKSLTPVWNETFVLPLYRFHDSLEFVVSDHDEPQTGCCRFFDDGDDLLGSIIIRSHEIHPNGFDGELHLLHAGIYHKNAFVKVKIEILGKGTAPADANAGFDVNIGESAPSEKNEACAPDGRDEEAKGLGRCEEAVRDNGAESSPSDLPTTIGAESCQASDAKRAEMLAKYGSPTVNL
jgi:hypothetical protein